MGLDANPDRSKDNEQVAGSAAVSGLTDDDKRKLLALTRQVLIDHLEQREPARIEADSEALSQQRAAFVTWRKRSTGELRGCIGEVIAQRSLIESVVRMAVASGTQDPRFPPITMNEMPNLTVEISALTPMTPIEPDDVEVGRHGLMIAKGHRSGLLLPQVPVEQGWSREGFLRGLCSKAGLRREAWKDPDVRLLSFEAEVWGEEENG